MNTPADDFTTPQIVRREYVWRGKWERRLSRVPADLATDGPGALTVLIRRQHQFGRAATQCQKRCRPGVDFVCGIAKLFDTLAP